MYVGSLAVITPDTANSRADSGLQGAGPYVALTRHMRLRDIDTVYVGALQSSPLTRQGTGIKHVAAHARVLETDQQNPKSRHRAASTQARTNPQSLTIYRHLLLDLELVL